MFSISIGEIDKYEPDAIGIKWNNYKKEIGYTIQSIPFKKIITPFVVNILFQSIGLAWIVENTENLNFDVQELRPSWMGGVTCYNSKQLSWSLNINN